MWVFNPSLFKPIGEYSMKTNINEVEINGEVYVKKGLNNSPKVSGEYKVVRTYSAGVFVGIVESRNGREVVLRNARRLWYWEGASTLSQLAMEGVKLPKKCRFPCAVGKVELLEVVEILDMTEEAVTSINKVPVWEQ